MLDVQPGEGNLEHGLGADLSIGRGAGRVVRRKLVGTLRPGRRSTFMTRYFFDIREGDKVAIDEEGKDLPSVESAQEEAARSLADLARDKIGCYPFCQMSIEVRDTDGPVVEAKFVWELRQTRH
jgi:hypothetical protein